MRLSFRKSIHLPLGFRMNLSRSGVGFSWGFPGFRLGRDSRRRVYQSISLPGTGLSAKQYIKKEE